MKGLSEIRNEGAVSSKGGNGGLACRGRNACKLSKKACRGRIEGGLRAASAPHLSWDKKAAFIRRNRGAKVARGTHRAIVLEADEVHRTRGRGIGDKRGRPEKETAIGGATCAKVLIKAGGDRMHTEKALNKFRAEGDMSPAFRGDGLRRKDVTVG